METEIINSCKNCIIDPICTKSCEKFSININRFINDDEIYIKRIFSSELKLDLKLDGYDVKINTYQICWYKNGELHRDGDKPAVIYSDGERQWWINGKRHRDDDKPAVILNNGEIRWWINGRKIK